MKKDELLAHLVTRLGEGRHPRRIFHGRGHCYEGMDGVTVDWFHPSLLITFYSEPAPIDAPALVQALQPALLEAGITGVQVQRRQKRRAVSETIWGEVASAQIIEEAGLSYEVRLPQNQNVGLFLDVQPLRQWVGEYAQGKRVLNLFAFTCAFSVVAIHGGAKTVVNLDMSRTALEHGKRNHELNGHDTRAIHFYPHDVFRSWWKLKKLGPFDLVIIDPPTYQRGSFDAEKDYGTLLKRLKEFTQPGSDVLALLNSPYLPARFLTEQMQRRAPQAEFMQWLPRSEDFPDQSDDRALKIAHFRIRR